MHRVLLASVMLVVVAVALGAPAALAHGDEDGAASIVVEPKAVSPGGTILVAGTELEPDMERLLLLRGEGLTVDLGTSATTSEGRLSQEVVIPTYVPAGVYQLEAIGDETLTVALQVVGGVEGGALAAPGSDVIDQGPREKGALELGLVILLAIIAGAIGIFLVVRAEKLGPAPN